MTSAALRLAVGRALGAEVRQLVRLSGGDINQAFRAELADGHSVFVKHHAPSIAGMFRAEARGLDFLRATGTLRVPKVLAVDDAAPAFLVLEFLEPGSPATDHDERLGRGLAAMHRFGAPSFGLDHDNFIGRLPQENAPSPTWVEFYRDRRLCPQLALARSRGLLEPALSHRFDALCDRLAQWVGDPEPPSRLHGDLWGGNLHTNVDGQPALIDPAVYGGHREVDLAMMRLFGGFSPAVFAAYREAWPLPAGDEDRVALYQLYPLLVHVNLFGGSYVGAVRRALSAYA